MNKQTISPKTDISEKILSAVKALQNGKVIIIPTETVYGLAADPFNEKAVRKIFSLKKRAADVPLQVLISDISQVKKLARRIPAKARRLMKESWPGPLTIVFKKKNSVPDFVTAGLDTVGIRMPDHPVTLELIKAFGGPLAATSANISGKKAPTTAAEAKRHFKKGIACAIDAGPSKIGKASRVVSIVGDRTVVIRR